MMKILKKMENFQEQSMKNFSYQMDLLLQIMKKIFLISKQKDNYFHTIVEGLNFRLS